MHRERMLRLSGLTAIALTAMLAIPANAQSQQEVREPLRLAQAGGALPPHEILTIIRSTGMNPTGQPVRRGGTYVLDAIDGAGEELRVVVGAQHGEILSVTTRERTARNAPALTLGPYQRTSPIEPDYLPPEAADDYPPEAPGVYSANRIYEEEPPRGQRFRPPTDIAPSRGYDPGVGSRVDRGAALPPYPGMGSPTIIAPGPGLLGPGGRISSAPLDPVGEPSRGPVMMPPDADARMMPPDADGRTLLPPPPGRFQHRATPSDPKAKPPVRTTSRPAERPAVKPAPKAADKPGAPRAAAVVSPGRPPLPKPRPSAPAATPPAAAQPEPSAKPPAPPLNLRDAVPH